MTENIANSPNNRLKWRLLVGIFVIFLLSFGAFAFYNQQQRHNQSCISKKQPFAYSVCQFNPNNPNTTLQLAWERGKDEPFLNFKTLLDTYPNAHFAMNAGMYNDKFAPIGYTVINSKEILSLNLKDGAGNFHLMPNGVFWYDKNGYHITESNALDKLVKDGAKPIFATQSGPMLVINGALHPKFNATSSSYKIRNGVGICKHGQIQFVISDEPVNFYQFASLFKDELACDNALFLDGGIASALYSKELGRADNKPMGVMIVGLNK